MAKTDTRTETNAADATLSQTDATIADAEVVADSPTSSLPQVGDVTPRGVIAGVRRHHDGAVEVSFNGADFEPQGA